MKKFILLVFLFCAFAAFEGHAFTVNGRAQFNQAQGYWIVNNFFNRPIICSGNVYCATRSGMQFVGYMTNALVYPGQYAYGQCYTNNPQFDPLVRVWGDVDCQWY